MSVIRCKLIDARTVVRGREKPDGPMQVFPVFDYVAVTFEAAVNFEPALLATELGPFDIYPLVHKKDQHVGYQSLSDTRLGTLLESRDTEVGASGKPSGKKQVLTPVIVYSLVLTLLCTLRLS